MAIWKRLRLYAIHNYGWTQSTVGVGLDLEAIVQEAILDTLTGVRRLSGAVPWLTVAFSCAVVAIAFSCGNGNSGAQKFVRQKYGYLAEYLRNRRLRQNI
jgi:hypothetical protein